MMVIRIAITPSLKASRRVLLMGLRRCDASDCLTLASHRRSPMSKTRLEAFSDGVIAILITIMVLEFKTPGGHDWAECRLSIGLTQSPIDNRHSGNRHWPVANR